MKRGLIFNLTLAWTSLYLLLVVAMPLAAFGWFAAGTGLAKLWSLACEPRVLSALALSFGCSAAAALVACSLGLLIAWVLDRYRFPGKRALDLCVDLPLALPTAVGGLALSALFSSQGWLGAGLIAIGMPVAFTKLGIVVALLFTALPAVIRSLQPVLRSLDRDVEEAAACLGATRPQTFKRVLFPQLYGGLASGFILAFSRALSEYGSVAFLSGNLPLRTEVVPVLVLARIEQGDLAAASAVACAHLLLAALALLSLGWFQERLAGQGRKS